MSKLSLGVPVKTRLPVQAWIMAGVVALISLASSHLHLSVASHWSSYAGVLEVPLPGRG